MFIYNIKLYLKILVLASFVLITNCSVNENYSVIDKTPEAEDPWENLNRGTFAFNQKFDKYLLSPVAKGYRFIFPSEIRTGVRNFLSNLSEPWTSVNSILQGDFTNTGNAIARFLINSTAGILGIFDVATEIGFEKQKEDFGQTLAVHGVGPGPYLMLPFLGPSTLRDALGKITSLYADPVTLALERNDKDQWIWIGMAVKGVDFREQNLEKIDNLNATSVDFYATLRSLYLERRSSMIRNQNVNDTDPFQEFDVE
ncbi:MAG: VacJ family lipoprotein [Pseudomonadota bacterium]|nr:VacJ family lipoprotein [Pseudomonadota bacterium]